MTSFPLARVYDDFDTEGERPSDVYKSKHDETEKCINSKLGIYSLPNLRGCLANRILKINGCFMISQKFHMDEFDFSSLFK